MIAFIFILRYLKGLSIGASISQNLALGITNAIAAWFANIPQELGKHTNTVNHKYSKITISKNGKLVNLI